MKKIPYLLTFSFIALFSGNSFATSTPLDLHLSKTPTTETTPISPVTETSDKGRRNTCHRSSQQRSRTAKRCIAKYCGCQ